jgi:hypothetical protein
LKWRRGSKYHETCGDYNVAAVMVNGVWHFELWQRQGKGWVFVSRHATADEARAACDLR